MTAHPGEMVFGTEDEVTEHLRTVLKDDREEAARNMARLAEYVMKSRGIQVAVVSDHRDGGMVTVDYDGRWGVR